jgi:hypothetical protein
MKLPKQQREQFLATIKTLLALNRSFGQSPHWGYTH